MPRRYHNLPANAQNPFEQIGMDKAFLEILIEHGDEEVIGVALSGLKRVVARALHPDTGINSPDGTAYLDSFTTAASRLEAMQKADRTALVTLAQAYVRQRSGGARPKQTQEVYESKDLHDGTLLRNIFDMTAQSGESIASLRNTRLLVRPLDFSMSKPAGAGGSYSWFPPKTARISMFETDRNGKSTWKALRQSSFTGELRKELKQNDVAQEEKARVAAISEAYWRSVEEASEGVDFADAKSLTMFKLDGLVQQYLPNGRPAGEYAVPDELEELLQDGIYTFGLSNDGVNERGLLYDAFYLVEKDVEGDTSFMLAGFGDKEFLEIQRKQIFADPGDRKWGEAILPSTSASREAPYSFAVPAKMHKYLQKGYSPLLQDSFDNQLLLGTNDDAEVLVMGDVFAKTSFDTSR